MPAPALNDYEYQLGDTGVLLNADNSGVSVSLPFIDIERIQGLDSAPFRTSQRDHEGIDGGYVDSEYVTTRVVTFEGIIFADPADPETICDQLKANWAPSRVEIPLYLKHPGKAVRVVYGKPQGARYDVEALRRTGQTPVQLQLLCARPHLYSANENSVDVSISTAPTTGFGFPLSFSFGFGSDVGASKEVLITNDGNRFAEPVTQIWGPVIRPQIVHVDLQRTLAFEYTLAAGEYLELNHRAHTVKLNGSNNRRSALLSPSRWWNLLPGVNNVRFDGTQNPPAQPYMPATLNVLKNPSLGTNTTGWVAGTDTTIARVTSPTAKFGAESLRVTRNGSTTTTYIVNTNGTVGLDPVIVSGANVTVSFYVYIPAAAFDGVTTLGVSGTDGFLDNAFTFGFVGKPSSADTWVRVSLSTTILSGKTLRDIGIQIWTDGTHTNGTHLAYIDGIQVEQHSAATSYCDGDQPNCSWSGTAHASTSSRLEIPEVPTAFARIFWQSTWH